MVFGMLLRRFRRSSFTVPLILPVAILRRRSIHLGIISSPICSSGIFLPPAGMNLFIASVLRFRQPVTTVIRASVPFLMIMRSRC
jgi:TRAP-type C4-dicarboxylate transport system permease large subunit